MIDIRVIVAVVALQISAAACVQLDFDAPEDGPLDRNNYVDLADLRQSGTIERRLRHVLRNHESELELIVRNGATHRGNFTLAEDDSVAGHLLVVRGDAEIRGRVLGNLVTLDGDVRIPAGGAISGEALLLNGEIHDGESRISGDVRMVGAPVAATEEAGPVRYTMPKIALWIVLVCIVSVFLTLFLLGLGLIAFARRHFETVSRTVSHSFGRSFLVGFVGQILLAPTLGIVVVGLIVSGIGILLLPFVLLGYVLLTLVGLAGGYLAVAHGMGKTYLRRRPIAEPADPPNAYRALTLGLSTLAVFTLVIVGIGSAVFLARSSTNALWVPIIGGSLWTVAHLVSWTIMTAGFGAVLLSRAGTRANFAGGDE